MRWFPHAEDGRRIPSLHSSQFPIPLPPSFFQFLRFASDSPNPSPSISDRGKTTNRTTIETKDTGDRTSLFRVAKGRRDDDGKEWDGDGKERDDDDGKELDDGNKVQEHCNRAKENHNSIASSRNSLSRWGILHLAFIFVSVFDLRHQHALLEILYIALAAVSCYYIGVSCRTQGNRSQ